MSSPEDGDADAESRPVSEESLTSRLAIRSRPQSSTNSQSISSPGIPKSLTSSSNESKARLPRFRAVKSATDSYRVSDTRERSTSSDFRSVIDDLTIKNQKLKKKLQKLQSKKDHEKSLFELKIHDLSAEKSAELVSLLRTFVETIPEGAQEQGHARANRSSDRGDNGGGDSAYASLTPGDSSTDASSQIGKTNKPRIDVVQMRQSEALPGTKHPLPAMSKDLIKMKMVVQRLEQVFMGRQGQMEVGHLPTKGEIEESKKTSQNVEYLHHLTSNRSSTRGVRSDPDENEWIYLNLLNNEAKLHEFNVTPMFIRRAVSTMSRSLELSPDGQRVRWRGTEGSPIDDDEYFPPIPEHSSPEAAEPAKAESSTKPNRKTVSSVFAPARYASPKDDLPVSLRYDPVFQPKDASSSSSNIDSIGTSSLSSSEGEDPDGKAAGPISFFKGKFFLDLTSTDPNDVMVDEKDEPMRILGSPVDCDTLTHRRTNWRRLSPTSVYFTGSEASDDDFEPLQPFVVASDFSAPDSQIRYDDNSFDSTGLTRLEDHFTVTLHMRATSLAKTPQPKWPSSFFKLVQPHVSVVLKEIEADRESLSSESESDREPKILDVTYAKLAPTKPPPTFYHQNSTSSDELSISS